MRQMLIHVPRGSGQEVVRIACDHDGTNISRFEARDQQNQPVDVVIAHLSNAQVGPFIAKVSDLPDLRLSLAPQGVFTLEPPESDVAQQITDVTVRSPIEVFLAGLQSIGSWRGFLGYAVVAGIVVWLGLFTNTVFLLVGAMLIAPFAGPAMNAAIATARGELNLLWRSLLRYVAALAASIVTAGALSLVFRQEVASEQMIAVANISSATVLLPIAAGAAGALNLVQSQRSSLVSGAAAGMLIAASLAPPAGLAGMAAVIGRWDLAKSGLFLLVLQLVGINLTGAIVFRLFGLTPEGARYSHGKPWVVWTSGAATVLVLVAILAWQFGSSPPTFQRSTIEERVRATVGDVFAGIPEADLVEASVRFTRADIEGQNTLLVEVYAQRGEALEISDDELRRRLTERIQHAIEQRDFQVTPLVDVTVLSPPSSSRPTNSPDVAGTSTSATAIRAG